MARTTRAVVLSREQTRCDRNGESGTAAQGWRSGRGARGVVGPLQSLAGQCSDTTFMSKGGPVPQAGMAPRGLRTGGQRRSRGVGQAGWDAWEREEARAELGEPGRVRARGVPRAAPHSGRGLSPLTAENVRLREKWWLFWGHSACKRQSQGSNSDSRACVCTHCSVLPSQGIAS